MAAGVSFDYYSQVNAIPVSVTFTYHDEEKLTCREVDCPVLPWLKSASDIQHSIRQALTASITEFWAVNRNNIARDWSGKTKTYRDSQAKWWSELKGQLQEILCRYLQEYHISVKIEIAVTIEQHFQNRKPPAVRPDWMTWESFHDVLTRNGKSVSRKDLQIVSGTPPTFSPDIAVDNPILTLKVSRKLYLKSIKLLKDDYVLASGQIDRVLHESVPNRVSLPTLPVSCYHVVKAVQDKEQQLKVHFEFLGGGQTTLDVPVSIPNLDGEGSVLFIDLGSTTAKMVLIRLNRMKLVEQTASDFEPLIETSLRSVLAMPTSEHATTIDPMPTAEFIEYWQLPEYNKQDLTKSGEDALASWFGRAARVFAASAAKKNRLIAKIYWSFPSVDDIDVAYLRRAVNREASPWMLGNPALITEHEALRYRFEETLKSLAAQANNQRKKQRRVKSENEKNRMLRQNKQSMYEKEKYEYDAKGVISRFFSKPPSKPDLSLYADMPVPGLEAWHQEFLRLNIREELDEFVIIDAGGYTLDIYIKVRGKPAYGHSFEAGGEELTKRVLKLMQSARGQQNVTWEQAENRKRLICESRSTSGIGEHVQRFTKELYGPAIKKGLHEGLKSGARPSVAGVPLIFSGGGMKNPWLIELLEETLDALGVKSMRVNSESLSEDIALFNLDNPATRRFQAITKGFAAGKVMLDIRRDITGGLIECGVRGLM